MAQLDSGETVFVIPSPSNRPTRAVYSMRAACDSYIQASRLSFGTPADILMVMDVALMRISKTSSYGQRKPLQHMYDVATYYSSEPSTYLPIGLTACDDAQQETKLKPRKHD